jgi:nitrogen fixation protein NifQ
MTLQPPDVDRERIYAQLMQSPANTPNQEWLACMLASWCAGASVLPDYLGLECHAFNALKNTYFADYLISEHAPSGNRADFQRMSERQDLIALLKHYGNPQAVEIDWIIAILVAGCLGNDHLWQDLGLWSRSQLTELLHYNFPELAAKNVHDMKWKKFLYKQLCETQGLYVCRVPSCEFCVDYLKCYETED